jgi:glyoxylase-like metal-dependent hydrolase (beta-lactamase superfamily II)
MFGINRREFVAGAGAFLSLTIISKIRALTDKPIRFAFDTHHHGDHAYGNQVYVENGGVPVAHRGVIRVSMRYAQVHQFDRMPAVIENQILRKENRRRFKLRGS